MANKKYQKGDVIMTNPAEGYYGVAVVLDDAVSIEISPGKMSYPLNHIMTTPLIFTRPITMDDIERKDLIPLIFKVYMVKGDLRYFMYDQICIGIYTNRNKRNHMVIGSIDTTGLYCEPLLWEPMEDRFHLCGDTDWHLGIEAYISYCEDNGVEMKRE